MIVTNDAITTVLVKEFGMGRHDWDLQITDAVRFTVILTSRATVTITAITWTKTAFAITLLRLTTGMTKAFVWFIIISINIAMGFSALFPWIRCSPVAKAWDDSVPGTCWPRRVEADLWTGTGGVSSFSFSLSFFFSFFFSFLLFLGAAANSSRQPTRPPWTSRLLSFPGRFYGRYP